MRDEVELDRAFYEAQLNPLSVRVGRIPLPLGIYSELRDAGHLAPFYGPPVTIYGETSYASSRSTGPASTPVSSRIRPGASTPTSSPARAPFPRRAAPAASRFRIPRTSGAPGCGSTPRSKVWRFGFNHHAFATNESIVFRNGENQSFSYLSFDFTRDRWLVRSEYGDGDFKLAQLGANVKFGYVTVGFSPLPKFWVYLQTERRDLSLAPKVLPDRRVHDSIGLSLTYAISERVVIKLEHQDVESTDVDRLLGPLEIPSVKATIASISVAY